jgi:hypothetical protein
MHEVPATAEGMGELTRVQQIAGRPLDVVVERDMRMIPYQRSNAVTGGQERSKNVRPNEPRSAG